MSKYRVYVTYKDSILDPEAEAVRKGAVKLGYSGLTELKMGKYFDIALDGPASDVEKLADTLLANPNMEKFEVVEVVSEGSQSANGSSRSEVSPE